MFTEEAGYDLSFQKAFTEPYTKKNHKAGLGKRAYPDIAAPAGPWMTYQGGSIEVQSGTSAAAPTVAAIVASAYSGTRFGWLNPMIYEKSAEGFFWDITTGNNHWGRGCAKNFVCHSEAGFQTAKGWDPVTGVGTFGNKTAGGAQKFLNALGGGSP